MATLKYSRQREAIKQYLEQSYEHPTADMVYFHVRQEFPSISLGTVYRNLNLLTDIGSAIKISMPDGSDRFDGRTIPHNHFLCKSCGNVSDIHLNSNISQDDMKSAGFNGELEGSTTMFYGKCQNCIG